MLYRKIEHLIEEHLRSNSSKILLIDGARQVGKTFIIRHAGQRLFENFIEVNMVEDSLGDRLFANTKTVEDFYLHITCNFPIILYPTAKFFKNKRENACFFYFVGYITS